MSKKIFILAACSVTGIASAQSSLTVFGIVDATVALGRGSTSNMSQLSRGGLSTPRIGFRGMEDLGSGLKAGFWLEAQANTDDGTSSGSNTNNQTSGATSAQGLTFARRATVSLLGTAGEVRLGRDVVPQYHNLAKGNVFDNVGVGTSISWNAIITGPTSIRASNMISYFSPNFGGLSGQLSHWFGENPSGTATSQDGSGSGINISYEIEKLKLGIATGRTHFNAGNVTQSNIFASYDFDSFKISGSISKDKNGSPSARGADIGASMTLGSGTAKVSYSYYHLNTNEEAKKIAIGYVYPLSKRTALYATAAYLRNSGGAQYALNNAKTGPNSSSTGYDFGLRHTF